MVVIVMPVIAQKTFSNLEEVLYFVRTNSITVKTNDIKLIQAKKAKLAALIGVTDPTGSVSANLYNNLNLPVSLFPAEILGGAPGTFQEVQTGVRYNTSVNGVIDIKLLNVQGLLNLRLAKTNLETTETDNQVALSNLYGTIAAAYFNIVQLQAQLKATEQNALAADTLLRIAEEKYSQGLVRIQDVNESKINLLNTRETVRQIRYLIEQGYLSFKILCDIPETERVVIPVSALTVPATMHQVVELNKLQIESSALKQQYAWADYKRNNSILFPTLSLVLSESYNQYNQDFTIAGGSWIHSNYIGLKLNIPLPSASTLSNRFKARYEYELASRAAEQTQIKTEIEQQQMRVDFEKSLSQYANDKEILTLRKDTYLKNKNLYTAGLLGMEQTLTSFTNMMNSEYTMLTSMVNVDVVVAKIYINNTMNK
jgi:outer membrane protein TolC